jgi:hypothetical protein
MLPYRLDAATDTPPTPAGPTAGPAARPPAPFPVLTPESLPRLQSLRVRRTPLSQFEVFVCIGNVHGSRNRRQRLHYVLLHSLDEVFDPWIHSAFCKIAIDSPRSTLGWSDYRERYRFVYYMSTDAGLSVGTFTPTYLLDGMSVACIYSAVSSSSLGTSMELICI